MILINLEKPKQDAGLNCTNKRIQFVAILLLQKKKIFNIRICMSSKNFEMIHPK